EGAEQHPIAFTQRGPSSGGPITTAGVLVTSVRALTTVADVTGGVPVAGVNVTWNRCSSTFGRVAFLANVTSRKIRVSWNGPTVLVLPLGNARVVASRSAACRVPTISSPDFVLTTALLEASSVSRRSSVMVEDETSMTRSS